jgi:hypothetical protein
MQQQGHQSKSKILSTSGTTPKKSRDISNIGTPATAGKPAACKETRRQYRDAGNSREASRSKDASNSKDAV